MVVQSIDDAEPPIDERSDETLLALLTQRDQRALVALYDRYGARVFALASRLLSDSQVAEEVTQDVFLRLWQRAETFHPGTSSFLAWLLAITRNRSIDEMRSRRAIARRRESLELTNVAAAAADPQSDVEDRLLAADVRQALADLPPTQRRAVELAIFGGLTHSEIAAALDSPLGTVKSWLRVGLQRLRNTLGQGWPGA
jgi:RNA polymerase sigma-70 factor (ECF subfamily)